MNIQTDIYKPDNNVNDENINVNDDKENTVSQQFRKNDDEKDEENVESDDTDDDDDDDDDEDDEEEEKNEKVMSTKDVIKEYYELKQNYINKSILYKKKKKEIVCINCLKPGGTLFSSTNGVLIAKCKASIPCKLNIEIHRGKIIQIRELEDNLHKKITDYKKNMITIKLDLLFGYQNEEKTIELFKENNKLLTEYERLLYECHNYEVLINKEKEEKLNDYNKQFKEKINNVKELLSIFENTKKHEHIHEIMTEYVSYIYPLIEKIRVEKYHHMDVECVDNKKNVVDKTDNERKFCRLVQDEFTIEENEMYVGDETKVVHYSL
jgi:hypothetical protein